MGNGYNVGEKKHGCVIVSCADHLAKVAKALINYTASNGCDKKDGKYHVRFTYKYNETPVILEALHSEGIRDCDIELNVKPDQITGKG